MKRIYKLGICLCVWFMGINIVDASINLVCPSKVIVGDKFTCTVKANYGESYGGVEAKLMISDGIEYVDFSRSYSNGEIYNNKLSVYDVDLKKGESTVGKITFKLKKTASGGEEVSLVSGIIFDEDSKSIKVSDVSKKITVQKEPNKSSSISTNNSSGNNSQNKVSTKIEKLVIEGFDIGFKSDNKEYELTVGNDVELLELKVTLVDSKGKINITGNKDFQEGENIVNIEVTDRNGKKDNYKIKVNKLAKSNNNMLKSLVVKNYNIDFNKEKLVYFLVINNEDKLDIEALKDDDKATLLIGGNQELGLWDTINIIVEAENKTTRMYEIKIIKRTFIWIILGGLVGILGLILITTIIVYKNGKKNNQIFMDLM